MVYKRKQPPEQKSSPEKVDKAKRALGLDKVKSASDAKAEIDQGKKKSAGKPFSNGIKGTDKLDKVKPVKEKKKKLSRHETSDDSVEIMAKYEFTPKELENMSDKVMENLEGLDSLELEKKASMSTFKEKMDVLKHDTATLRIGIRNGHEQRRYKCKLKKDYKLRKKIYTDFETGKPVDVRPFSPGDEQRAFI